MSKTLTTLSYTSLACLFLFLGILTSGCKGPEGPMGPQGEPGPEPGEGENDLVTWDELHDWWRGMDPENPLASAGCHDRVYGGGSVRFANVDDSVDLISRVLDRGLASDYVDYYTIPLSVLRDQTFLSIFFNAGLADNPSGPSAGRPADRLRLLVAPPGTNPSDPLAGFDDKTILAENLNRALEGRSGLLTHLITDPEHQIQELEFNSEALEAYRQAETDLAVYVIFEEAVYGGGLGFYAFDLACHDHSFDGQRLIILHFSDLESAILPGEDDQGGLARISAYVKSLKDSGKRVLLLSGGDSLMPGPLFNYFGGQAVFRLLSLAGLDAAVPGNHEFDRGESILAGAVHFADFPLVGSNVDLSPTSQLRGQLPPHTVVDLQGMRVGIFGILDPQMQTGRITHLAVDTILTDPIEASQQVVDELQSQGVDLLVGLLHQAGPGRLDRVIAENVSGIDVMIVGGAHGIYDPVARPDENVLVTPVGPVLSVSSTNQGRVLGQLDLIADEGRILSFRYNQIPVTAAMGEDRTISSLAQSFIFEADRVLMQPVGATRVTLDGNTRTNRYRETNMGNFFCDALLDRFPEADAALQNGGSIRHIIPKGPITLRDMHALLPFGGHPVLASVSFNAFFDILENSFSLYEDGPGRFLQVSDSLQVIYDLTRPPGERVRSVKLRRNRHDPDSMHLPVFRTTPGRIRLIINDFIAAGGDEYNQFELAEDVVDTGMEIAQVLTDAISSEGGPIEPVVDGRLLSHINQDIVELLDSGTGGQSLVFRGTVTVGTGTFGGTEFHVQDGIVGIRVMLQNPPTNPLSVGDFVEVTGTLNIDGRQPFIGASNVQAVYDTADGETAVVLQPHPMSMHIDHYLNNLEFYLGSLVIVSGIRKTGEDAQRIPGGWLVPITGTEPDSLEVHVRLYDQLELSPEDLRRSPFQITGIVTRTGQDQFHITPRSMNDLQ